MSDEKVLKVHESNLLEEGLHKGVIVDLDYHDVKWNEKDLEYMDLTLNTEKGTAKVSYNAYISTTSKLGLLLERFGADLKELTELKPEEFLLNKKCQFMVEHVDGDGGAVYHDVLKQTLKPLI